MAELVPPDPRLVGLWRRSLLVRPDGTRDTTDDVRWLQAGALYVDTRGFAGRLEADGAWTCWRRDVDLLPPGPADEGRLVERDGVVVETGRHEAYTEHWHREPFPVTPVAGALLRSGDAVAVLVRVGPHLGWADGDGAVLTTSLDPAALTARPWEVVRSEGDPSSLPLLRTESSA